MDKKNLDKKLEEWIKELPQESKNFLLARLSGLKSIYPFNEYEYRLMYLLDRKIITFKEYEKLRNAYVNANPYLNWVLTNKEVKKHPIRSHQHRGGIEYQIGITEKNIKEFKRFLAKPNRLVGIVKSKARK